MEFLKALSTRNLYYLFSKPQLSIVFICLLVRKIMSLIILLYYCQPNKKICCRGTRMKVTLPDWCYLFFIGTQKVAEHLLVRFCQPFTPVIALFHVFIEESLASEFWGGTSVKKEKPQWSSCDWAKITLLGSLYKNLSVCCPNKCLGCVKHTARWPQEEKSIAIHISCVYNCLWKPGSGLFAGQIFLSCCVLSFLISNGHVFHNALIYSEAEFRLLFFLLIRITILITGALYWIWSVHWTVDRHRPCTGRSYFAVRFLKVWGSVLCFFCFEVRKGVCGSNHLSLGQLFIRVLNVKCGFLFVAVILNTVSSGQGHCNTC